MAKLVPIAGKPPTVATGSPGFEHQFAGHVAGAPLTAGMACQINASSQVIPWTSGTVFAGICSSAAAIDEPVTLYNGVTFHYVTGLTPGQKIYLSVDGSGALDNAATAANVPVGFARDASRIYFFPLTGVVTATGAA